MPSTPVRPLRVGIVCPYSFEVPGGVQSHVLDLAKVEAGKVTLRATTFTVQELYETLIPYRHHRRELGIETNQDYEIAMTKLLSGERDYLQADQSMREKLKSELQSPHMDPGAFREFAGSKVSLAPEALRRIRALTVASSDEPANGVIAIASGRSGRSGSPATIAPSVIGPTRSSWTRTARPSTPSGQP